MTPKRLTVITGATGGIGTAVTRRLAADPQTLLLLHGCSNEEKLNMLARSVNAESVTADLTSTGGTDRLFTSFEKLAARYDPESLESISFIFAAGTDLMSPAMKSLPFGTRMTRCAALDLYAPVRLSRRFAEWRSAHRQEAPLSRDTVLFFSWDGVDRGMEGDTAQIYAICKGGLASFARSFTQDQNGAIRVLTISPGWIATAWGTEASDKMNRRVASESLARRWGTPNDAAELAAYLISDRASYLNGVTIPLNGGFNFAQTERLR